MMSSTPPFNVHLDPADVDFLKKKTEECNDTQRNVLLREEQGDPYIRIIGALEQSLEEGTGTA